MALKIVPYHAVALAGLFTLLSLGVIRTRQKQGVSLGLGSGGFLERRVRVHANFSEYVPFTLLLLIMAELRGGNGVVLHILCVCLLVGRAAHAWGVSQSPEDGRFRVAGMASTFIAIIGAAVLICSGAG